MKATLSEVVNDSLSRAIVTTIKQLEKECKPSMYNSDLVTIIKNLNGQFKTNLRRWVTFFDSEILCSDFSGFTLDFKRTKSKCKASLKFYGRYSIKIAIDQYLLYQLDLLLDIMICCKRDCTTYDSFTIGKLESIKEVCLLFVKEMHRYECITEKSISITPGDGFTEVKILAMTITALSKSLSSLNKEANTL